MDSPETTAKTAATNSAATATAATSSSSSPPVQESPFSNFLSNLSPIEPVRAPHVLQGILGLNSPPLVFTSPHINAPQESSFLKRLQRPSFHQLLGAKASQNDDGGRKLADAPGDLEKSDSLLDSRLITDTQKNNDIRSSLQVQPSSSSGCVNEYLADPVDTDGANSSYGVNRNLKASAALQSSINGRDEKTLSKFDDKNDQELEVYGAVTVFAEARDSIHGKSTCDIKPIRNEQDDTCGVWPSDECPKMESNLSLDHASKKQQCQNSSAQNAGSIPGDETHCPPEWLPEPLQTLLTYEDSHGNAGEIPHESLDDAKNDSKASKLQRGMSRRCLQFEEAQPKATVDGKNSSKSPTTSVESESLDSPHVDLNATSSKRQLSMPQPVTPMFPPRHTGKFPVTASKPSGIGLHLNSIVNALPKGHGATVSVKSASADYGMLETKASISVSSFVSESVDDMGPMNWLPPVDHNATPHSKRNFNTEQSESFEEFSQLSPKTKRKKSSSTIDGDGCKRCNCKKTRCLKLYCDCFAAGIYCAEPCACQGCFNRPEYEDTVLETRQQIESRNPLAFAPKIVQPVTEFSDDGNRFTPSSARHKRGCNCKKSMCLKKYCECYQANVGCSSGCRCEGCKNVYGRKEEYVGNEEMVSKRARSEGTPDSHNPTSLTPPFECSDHGKDTLKSQILSSRYVPSPSPKSDHAISSSYAKTPRILKISDSNDMLLETRKEILDVEYYGQGRDYNSMDAVDQFSSRYQGLADLCDFTALQDFSSSAVASSASSKATDWTNVSRIQLCPRSSGLSSGGSLRWRGSLLTPMTQLGGSKNLQALDCNNRLSGTMEDDTPEILKDASTPSKSVKVSSPSRKRVSPPHGCRHELGSGSSGALKSGRKFILKAVPSFPPLTPCIGSKGSNYEGKNNFQENKQ